MLSCQKIADTLSKFEGGKTFKINNFNPLFEQSSDFDQKYLQLVEDKIQENGWTDPSFEPEEFEKPKREPKKEAHTPQDSCSDGEENTYLTYREHQTVDLPNELLSLIDKKRQSDIYYYGMKGPDSYLASVLLAVDPGYWFHHRKKRKEYANELKTTFNIKRHDLFREVSKSSIGYKFENRILESEFPEGLDSDKSIELQFLIGHNFGVNVLILDLAERTGYFTTDWDPEKVSVIILKDLKTYLPILSNKLPNFNVDEVKRFERRFNIVYPVKIKVPPSSNPSKSESKSGQKSSTKMITKVEDLDPNNVESAQFYNQSKYQLKDLQDFATKLGLSLDKRKPGPTGKMINKTKKDLYTDIQAETTKTTKTSKTSN